MINGGRFRSNTATECGGLFTNFGVVTVSATRFDFNRADVGGGGACNYGQLSVNSAIFTSNRAGAGGGGLYSGKAVTLTNSQFLTNSANFAGGALFADFAPPVAIHGGLFAGNTATGTLSVGGAVSATGQLALGGATFVGNSAATAGALAANGSVQISNTQFLANRATNGDGGALRLSVGGAGLVNVALVGNQASQRGGAIFVDGSGFGLLQLTAVSNTAAISGSVLFANNSGVQLANSVIWHNGPGVIGRQGTGLQFIFNLGDAGISNTGNISADPRFVRAPDSGDGNWSTLDDNDYGDLRLTFASPGIDAANNTLLTPPPPTDLAGRPRFVDIASVPDTGVGTAPIVDMGAYEFQIPQLFLPLVLRQP